MRILVIDDDAAIRGAVSSVLRRKGLEVALYGRGGDLLRAEAWRGADLIVSDLSMPGCDGIELALKLRQDGYAGPFIFITGGGPQMLKPFGHALSPWKAIEKPFRSAELIEALHSWDRSAP